MYVNDLTSEEVAIEKDADKLRPLTGKKREKIENILAKANKNRSISLRISAFALDRIKEKANRKGIPYQTLINSVLHKYITNQLFERSEIIKSINLLKYS